MISLSIREIRENMKRVKHPINLYHISLENHDGEVFHPRVPEVYNNDEDDTISRVCFSSTISGAYRAITFGDTYGEECYVHVPVNIDSIIKRGSVYKPSTNLVWDAAFTNEYWVRRPVKLKCIGKAKFYYKDISTWMGPWRPRVDFKWIEKYTENSLKRDLEKEKLCKEHGIKLLHFTYNKNHIPKDFNYYKVITDIDELKSEISKYIDETRRV